MWNEEIGKLQVLDHTPPLILSWKKIILKKFEVMIFLMLDKDAILPILRFLKFVKTDKNQNKWSKSLNIQLDSMIQKIVHQNQ